MKKHAIAVLAIMALCVGCGGMFSPPYDINKPAPAAEKTPADLVPKEIQGLAITDQATRELAGTVTGAGEEVTYDNGVKLTILKVNGASGAAAQLEQFYKSGMKASSKVKMGAGSYAWARGKGSGYFAFAWTNNQWYISVEGPSQAEAEKVILATGLASKPAGK
jgi:hypothetical protein